MSPLSRRFASSNGLLRLRPTAGVAPAFVLFMCLTVSCAFVSGCEKERPTSPEVGPDVTISRPHDSDVFQTGEWVTFSGAALDEQDGQLDGSSLVWSSHRDGEIGTGTQISTCELSPGSHGILLTATDSDGNVGFAHLRVWIGPFDVITVSAGGGADYSAIGPAIDAATPGDTVLVSPGVYKGQGNRRMSFGGKIVSVISVAGASETVIDCEGQDRAFSFEGGVDEGPLLRGFTIRNGSAENGGGVYCGSGAGSTFENCMFLQSEATSNGGGMFCEGSEGGRITIRNCVFAGNSSGGSGGGLAVRWRSDIEIRDCEFSENESAMYGGGLWLGSGSPWVTGCVFESNTAGVSGGGCSINGYWPQFAMCDFTGNAARKGGGLAIDGSSALVSICTLSGNYASESGGGISFSSSARPRINQCTLYANEVGAGGEGAGMSFLNASAPSPVISCSIVAFSGGGSPFSCVSSGPVIQRCCSFGNAQGDSLCGNHSENLFIDPLFCDAPGGDLSLHGSSPCLPENNEWSETIGSRGLGCSGR